MHGGIVEFHALSDTDGTGAKHDEFVLVRQAGLIGDLGVDEVCVGGIEVGDVFAGMQGIHHTEDGGQAVLFAGVVDGDFVDVPQTCDELIREAHCLGSLEDGKIEGLILQDLFHLDDLFDAVEE